MTTLPLWIWIFGAVFVFCTGAMLGIFIALFRAADHAENASESPALLLAGMQERERQRHADRIPAVFRRRARSRTIEAAQRIRDGKAPPWYPPVGSRIPVPPPPRPMPANVASIAREIGNWQLPPDMRVADPCKQPIVLREIAVIFFILFALMFAVPFGSWLGEYFLRFTE